MSIDLLLEIKVQGSPERPVYKKKKEKKTCKARIPLTAKHLVIKKGKPNLHAFQANRTRHKSYLESGWPWLGSPLTHLLPGVLAHSQIPSLQNDLEHTLK